MIAILAGIGIVAKQVFEWVVTGAIIGALIGGLIGGGTEIARGFIYYGEINRDVIDDAVESVIENAKYGALFGAAGSVFGGVFSAIHNVGRYAHLARNFHKLPQTNGRAGYIYVMEDIASGLKKIGFTNNPARRLNEVQRLTGKNLRYVGIKPVNNARVVERTYHNLFAGQNVASANGREWFNLRGYDLVTIFSN